MLAIAFEVARVVVLRMGNEGRRNGDNNSMFDFAARLQTGSVVSV